MPAAKPELPTNRATLDAMKLLDPGFGELRGRR
jgi:hypothetical protein